jgi:hypothetical protein
VHGISVLLAGTKIDKETTQGKTVAFGESVEHFKAIKDEISNKYIRSNKYLVSELRNSLTQIFNIPLFITCVYKLG